MIRFHNRLKSEIEKMKNKNYFFYYYKKVNYDLK